jgi:hypothetical protein
MGENKKVIERLRDAGQEKLRDMADELLSNPRFAEAFGAAIGRAVKTREKVDRNLRVVLNLANVPTKADYDDLVRKVVKLGDALGKLETRLDAIGARLERLGDKLAARQNRPGR